MPMRSPAASRGRWVPGGNVCAPWRSACISWAALSSARPSSAVRVISGLLLLVSPPPVGPPATNRARTLRKGISSLETAIAAVRQAYDGRSVGPRCRLLRSRLGSVSLGLHLYSLPFSVATPSALAWWPLAPLALCISYYNYTTRGGSRGGDVAARVEGCDRAQNIKTCSGCSVSLTTCTKSSSSLAENAARDNFAGSGL